MRVIKLLDLEGAFTDHQPAQFLDCLVDNAAARRVGGIPQPLSVKT
jgi:hypothetical protein